MIVGMAAPFATFVVQADVCVLQNWAEVQSPSTTQPPAGSHTPETEHAPLRHTVEAVPVVHDPSPFAKPQRLSAVSHTPATQTDAPTGALQVPVSAGVCPVIVGTAPSFATFATQAFVCVLQNCVAAQLASTVQLTGVAQTPSAHAPLRQTVPAFAGVHVPPPFA